MVAFVQRTATCSITSCALAKNGNKCPSHADSLIPAPNLRSRLILAWSHFLGWVGGDTEVMVDVAGHRIIIIATLSASSHHAANPILFTGRLETAALIEMPGNGPMAMPN